MNTGLAQLVALTAHGNLALLGRRPAAAPSLGQSNLFQFAAQLGFGTAPGLTASLVPTPEAWFDSLQQRGIQRLRLVRLNSDPDGPLKGYDRTAFANGEQAAVAAILPPAAMELWIPRWDSLERDGRHAWSLSYRGHDGGMWRPEWNGPAVDVAAAHLRLSLREIANFASLQGLERWVPQFEGARAALDEAPAVDQIGMLPDRGYPDAARQLLSAALSGWVFGGMGSWNDTGPDDANEMPRYEAFTHELYEAIMNSLVSSANAFDPAYL